MKGNKRRVRSRVRAFTLLEVLMVVVIIGLLAAFVVPSFFGAGEGVKIDLTQATIDSGLGGSLKMYRVHMGHYPTEDEGGLMALIEEPEDEELAKKWHGPYLEKVTNLRDAWGNELIYESPGKYNEDGYDLSSAGPDEQEDTDDDLCNWEKT
ncbi:MAG: type II secretion system major pseudopilin GspG [Phycisphaerae bacterium]|nr:type II secretion system major pseudopilin GspG [Phycisphaerae bacterium]